ncbi:MAG: isoprenylcysteine carboxylmethyltransferase family protein [Pseudomonadota bacterium]
MAWLEKRLPPPLLAIVAVVLLVAAAKLWPALRVSSSFQNVAGGLLIVIGVAIDLASILAFRRAQTTVNPLRPEATTQLVTVGPFHRSRNPMYVGLVLIVTGCAVVIGTIVGPFVVAAIIAYLTRFQIQPEERAMRELFSESFEHYCRTVPRWL